MTKPEYEGYIFLDGAGETTSLIQLYVNWQQMPGINYLITVEQTSSFEFLGTKIRH